MLGLAAPRLPVLAQSPSDVVYLTSGKHLAGKVLVVASDSLKLRLDDIRAAAPSMELVWLATAQVSSVRFGNGSWQHFSLEESGSLTAEQAHTLGRADALRNYKAKGLYWRTFGGSMLVPGLGLLTVADARARRPLLSSLRLTDADLLNDPDYVAGYRQQVQRHRVQQASAGLRTALAVQAVLLVLFAASEIGAR